MRIEYSFKTLVDSEHFCPYNRDVFNYLDQLNTCKDLINKIYSLYEQINFQFSSPGISFPRNVIYELNRPYRYDGPSINSLAFHVLMDKELEKDYDFYFNELRLIADQYKFRPFDQAFIGELNSANQVVLTSDFLTEDGMKKTILISSNIASELSKKIIYKSVDFWTTNIENTATNTQALNPVAELPLKPLFPR